MIQVKRKELCCGCTACENICNQKAIALKPDSLGFLYPIIDQTKCVDCGLCDRVCDFMSRVRNPLTPNDDAVVYAVRHRNMEEVSTSQSGAATIALVDWVLGRNGTVYGCGYGEHFYVMHKRAATKSEANEFKGSKYVQSYMGNCFSQVLSDLEKDHYVLFTGTGCQIAGLLSFLRTKNVDASNLVTCDIVCNGVPSQKLWQDYLNYVEIEKAKKPVLKVDFRGKSIFGWKAHKEVFYISSEDCKTYKYIFYNCVPYRKSCSICPYMSTQRLSDFTVCDFWGYEKTVPEMGNDDKGLSLMFVSTEKARNIFADIKESLNCKQLPISDCIQPRMHTPGKTVDYEKFEGDYLKHGFKFVMKKYGRLRLGDKIVDFTKCFAYKVLGRRGVTAIKNLLGM